MGSNRWWKCCRYNVVWIGVYYKINDRVKIYHRRWSCREDSDTVTEVIRRSRGNVKRKQCSTVVVLGGGDSAVAML